MSDRPPPPAPEPGPGPLFVPTAAGFDLQPRLPEEAERTDPTQIALHAQLRKRVARLQSSMRGIGNTHPVLAAEFADYAVFVARDLAELDVASLWSAGSGLATFIAALDDPRGAGGMTEPLEPGPLALLRSLLNDHTAFIFGFARGRALAQRAATLHQIDEPPEQRRAATAALLNQMLLARDLLTGKARPLVHALTRAFDELNATALPLMSSGWEAGRNALIGFGRHGMHRLEQVGLVVDLALIFTGVEHPETLHTAAAFLRDNAQAIAAFAASDPTLRDWLAWAAGGPMQGGHPALLADLAERSTPPPDFDMGLVRAMILAGRAPPASWCPFIHKLDLNGEESFTRADLLSGLIALQDLALVGTRVTDVSPLSSLTALQSLNLANTPVRDVSSLSGLTALQILLLMNTPVSDVSPLSSLTALQVLFLMNTPVIDVSPLSGLTALQSLNLEATPVSDVLPLSGLTALQALMLGLTQVTDVSPLSGLTALQSLDLGNTQVSDISPLSSLTALQSLGLGGTPVSDLSSLSSLTELRHLQLHGAHVVDVSPLRHIRGLKVSRSKAVPAKRPPASPRKNARRGTRTPTPTGRGF